MAFSTLTLSLSVVLVSALFLSGVARAARAVSSADPGALQAALTRGALLVLALLTANLLLGASGMLDRFDRLPPPFAVYLLP
jgi:hypothetical protein